MENRKTYDKCVTLLNEAQLEKETAEKIKKLRQVKELILYCDLTLLDNFLDEVLGFQYDTSVDVKKFLIQFIEEACVKDPEVLSKIVANLMLMLSDENVNVRKKIISTTEKLYQVALRWVCKTRIASESMEHTWEYFVQLKNRIVDLIDSDNDGVRTRVIRFIEACILLHSSSTENSEPNPDEIMSLNNVPRDHRFISYRKLEAEGKSMFQRILDHSTSQYTSSINLITCIFALSRIGRLRPEFIEKVVIAFETIQVNLPPTLAKAQVSSVRKELKKHLLNILRHPSSQPYSQQISTLLTDLGATQQQISKAVSQDSGGRKRLTESNEQNEEGSTNKKFKLSEEEDKDEEEEERGEDKKQKASAIDITAGFLVEKLNSQHVTDLVLLSMVMLPDVMPAQFQANYTPIAAAGTPDQIKHLARLMATQLTAAGLGPGVERQKENSSKSDLLSKEPSAGEANEALKDDGLKKPPVFLPSGLQATQKTTSKRLHQFGLAHITKPMTSESLSKMALATYERLTNAERRVRLGGALKAQVKLLVAVATEFGWSALKSILEEHIMSDQKNRGELALLWIYQEYASYLGFNKSELQDSEKAIEKYDACLVQLLGTLYNKGDHKDTLFHRILLEAPMLTPAALHIHKKACQDPVHGTYALETLRQMILRKRRQRSEFMGILAQFAACETLELRNQALEIARLLYETSATKETVSWHMDLYLHYLLSSTPPDVLFGSDAGRQSNPGRWEEDGVKACLYLYLHMLPVHHALIHELANVYVETSGDIKRVILRQLEGPETTRTSNARRKIKSVGMYSVELLNLVETCPKGAETLVTRIVHLLTERAAPSKDLVNRIRDLYKKRVPDVRFLIPVLSGLSKGEIIEALPKLIKLNANVVKEVFNRLLRGQASQPGGAGQQQLSPTELLISLHELDASPCEMKALISASNILLGERSIYTQEVLASVIQQLVEQDPLPTLLMRTVLQALALYPRLIGFIMNILQRLILKQVWKQSRVWEGFVRCCQKTKPQSFQVLLQLPPPQLKHVFILCPELREPLLQHINGLSQHQQAHISQSIVRVLQTEPSEYPEYQEQKTSENGNVEGVSTQEETAGDESVTKETESGSEKALESMDAWPISSKSPPPPEASDPDPSTAV